MGSRKKGYGAAEALLKSKLYSASLLVIEDTLDAKEVEERDPPAADPVADTPSCPSAKPRPKPKEAWRAVDFASELGDAFGLDATQPVEPAPEASVSLRDLNLIGRQRANQRAARIPRSAQATDLTLPFLISSASTPGASSTSSRPKKMSPLAALAQSLGGGKDHTESPRDCDSSGDEAHDAVASLEGLWDSAKKEGIRRLLRTAGSTPSLAAGGSHEHLVNGFRRDYGGSVPGLVVAEGSMASTGASPSSSAAATPRGPPGSVLAGGSQDDALSDSDSENSSSRSASSGSRPGWEASSNWAFGIHLDWKLKMQPRLPQATQVALQKGICPGCKERLPTSLFAPPRYCHYLGCYMCTTCHNGDLRVIPARVAERWDFEPRKVSSIAAKYLDTHVNQPLVPITSIKRTKVSSQLILTEVHSLRQQLTRVKEVLVEQDCPFGDPLRRLLDQQLEPHVVAGHELYSMQDLIKMEIHGKSCPLLTKLARLVVMATEHVPGCADCSRSARHCPVCASPSPLFPFQVSTWHCCKDCQTAYHQKCFKWAGGECPMCLPEKAPSSRRPSIAEVRAW